MTPVAACVRALAAGDVPTPEPTKLSDSDWHQVGQLAALHQVDALCWWMSRPLEHEGRIELPQTLRDQWRLAYLHHLLRNEALARDLATLLDALTAAGVEALILKGPWMAFHAFPDPGTRPVGDIDLCVRETQYVGALEALRSAGWRAAGPLPDDAGEALRESHYRRQLRFSARGRRPVELHFRLLNMGPPGPPEDWVWDNTRELRLGSTRLHVPGPEAMLLHLTLHANQHGFTVLRLLHDVRWALEADRMALDMARFQHTVRGLGCASSCYHALELAAELAGARRIASAKGLRPSLPRRALFSRLWQLDAARRLETDRRRQEMEAPLFYLLEMGRLTDKLRYAARVTAAAGGPLALARKMFRAASSRRRTGP